MAIPDREARQPPVAPVHSVCEDCGATTSLQAALCSRCLAALVDGDPTIDFDRDDLTLEHGCDSTVVPLRRSARLDELSAETSIGETDRIGPIFPAFDQWPVAPLKPLHPEAPSTSSYQVVPGQTRVDRPLKVGKSHLALAMLAPQAVVIERRHDRPVGPPAHRFWALADAAERRGDVACAVRGLRAGLRFEQPAWALNRLGILLSRQKDYRAAIVALERAVADCPQSTIYSSNLATVLALAQQATVRPRPPPQGLWALLARWLRRSWR